MVQKINIITLFENIYLFEILNIKLENNNLKPINFIFYNLY